ncbi:MAG: hypothetical protein IIA64_10810 [Planctomycetes bacterium]|nr:hypothetical protein [Planctomycetota bacterium]
MTFSNPCGQEHHPETLFFSYSSDTLFFSFNDHAYDRPLRPRRTGWQSRALEALPSLTEDVDERRATGAEGAAACNTWLNAQGAEAVISAHDGSQTPTRTTQVGNARNPPSVSPIVRKENPA